jgi:DNA end-binding protein Ku
MARPMWQGQVQISLVSFSVSLVPASTTSRPISFHEIDRKTGERVRHRKTSGEDAPVEAADIAKGYEYEKGQYLVIEPDDLKRLRLPGQKSIEVEHFVPRNEIDPVFFEKPYFLIPKDDAQARTMATFSRAMRQTGRVGLSEMTFSGREHFVAIGPPVSEDSPWLNMYLLRYQSELRESAEYYEGRKAPEIDSKQLALAEQLIESYSEPFNPAAFKDDYERALREFVEAKLNNRPLPSPEPEHKPGKVIDLMEALKRSLEQRKDGEKKPAASAKQEESAKAAEGTKPKTRRRKAA